MNQLKNWLLKKVISAQAPKWVRHGLAAVGGIFTAAGVSGNVDNVAELVAGLVAVAIASAWSYFAKRPIDAGWWEAVKAFGAAVARQTVAAIAGALALPPAALETGEITTTGAVLLALNLLLSAASAPDKVATLPPANPSAPGGDGKP